MDLKKLLKSEREEIIRQATESLSKAPLRHYRESDPETNRERFTRLYELTSECIQRNSLIPMLEYAEKVAEERYRQRFRLEEVQMAFNVLEEVMWQTIAEKTDPQDYPEAFGTVSTVLGSGKQSLAVTYLSLLSNKTKRNVTFRF